MAICVDCKREMVVVRIGVDVVELSGTRPYKIYPADVQNCPTCGHSVIDTSSRGKIVMEFDKGFSDDLSHMVQRNIRSFHDGKGASLIIVAEWNINSETINQLDWIKEE
jgi:hypothetical protein